MSAIATTVSPRAVFCVIDHTYRDVAVADAVRHGHFTHAGITLDLGPEPDWLGARLPPDPEWRTEWTKFYYGLDLAYAFSATNDAGYLETWQRLMGSWIDQVPADFDRADVTARRVLNWIYAWLRFASAPSFGGLDAPFVERLVDSIERQVRHVRATLTAERNHRTFELYALFVAALALPELDAERALLEFAVAELHANLLADIRPDGVHREASTHYHHVALRTYLGVLENARRFAVALPSGYRERLEQACEFSMHCHRPDGTIPALSDSDTGAYLDLLERAGMLFERDDFLFVATSGARGSPPAERHVSFEHGGYFFQRSGWGTGATRFADERYLMLDCGPLGDGGHGHYDLLNVEVAAGGVPLVVDPGRYVYFEDGENWRRWFKSTAAHNTVSVDGLDQTPYRRGAPRGPVARGQLLGRLNAPGLDVLWGEAHSPCYEAVHRRRVLFVGDEFWIVEDRLLGRQPHQYDLRFHLSPAAQDATTLVSEGACATLRAPGLALVVWSAGHACLDRGWVAPLYGHKEAAPVLSVRTEPVAEATFVSLIMPLSNERRSAPRMRPGVGGVEILGTGPSGDERDVVTWTGSSAAWVRYCGSGRPLRRAMCL